MDPQTRAWLIKELGSFDGRTIKSDLGELASRASQHFATQYTSQTTAWESELKLLAELAESLIRRSPPSHSWPVLLEYEIPRRQRRPDIILLAHNVVFVIEFKLGSVEFDAAARWQVENYSLDLRDFHAQSAGKPIVPVLVASDAPQEASVFREDDARTFTVWHVQLVAPVRLSELILLAYEKAHGAAETRIDARAWDQSVYRPSQNIIEAAQRLFSRHSVSEIDHRHADDLDATTERVIKAIRDAKRNRDRVVCFVTGVPGAGKTLVGLNAAHSPLVLGEMEGGASFLSGNGPLIKIVRAALVRDLKSRNSDTREAEIDRQVGSFIQNVHKFINDHSRGEDFAAPSEHVVVFDEAQRAWSREKMVKKERGSRSEPEVMLRIMEQLDWCALIALVGGGQEIHDGEAGLAEWGNALAASSARWRVLVSPEVLSGGSGVAGQRLFHSNSAPTCSVEAEPSLHLSVSQRSYRAQMVSDWVNRLLNDDITGAAKSAATSEEFPIVMTRELSVARQWLRARAGMDDSEGNLTFDRRCGLVASSSNERIRAHGLEVSSGFRKGYRFDRWFLDPPSSTQSSHQLEVAATEFECQGLELDWVGVCWGNDLVPEPATKKWISMRLYRGMWIPVRNAARQQFWLNKYRVLLTRAREGMVIWVPVGEVRDTTRPPDPLNRVAKVLRMAGVREIGAQLT